jgi:hypothetical protein
MSYLSQSQRIRHKHIAQIGFSEESKALRGKSCCWTETGFSEPNLFVGSFDALHLDTLTEFQITHVFCFVEPSDKLPTIVYEPVELDDAPDCAEKLLEIGKKWCAKIRTLHENPQNKVLVTCQAGRSRSISIIVMYLMEKYPELTMGEIMDIITKVRYTIINSGFWAMLLREYENTHLSI